MELKMSREGGLAWSIDIVYFTRSAIGSEEKDRPIPFEYQQSLFHYIILHPQTLPFFNSNRIIFENFSRS